MSKFVKNCCITALIFILIGGITLVVAMACGGSLEVRSLIAESRYPLFDMKDHISLDDDWITDRSEMHLGEYSDLTIATKEEVQNLRIQIGAAKVNVVESDDAYFQVMGDTVYPYQWYLENDTLVLKSYTNHGHNERWDITEHFLNENQITLAIPKDIVLNDITIEIGAGILTFDKVAANTFNIECGASNVTLGQLITDYADVEIGAGNMEIEQSKIREAEFDIGLGNLDLRGIISGNLNLQCGLGNVIMDLQDSEKNHNYDLDSNAGRIAVDNQETAGMGKEDYIDNKADSTYEIECNMGNIELDFND